MLVHEKIAIWAWIIAIVAVSNWAFGNCSVFGRKLNLRPGKFWLMARWTGMVVFLLLMVIKTQINDSRALSTIAILAALLMLIGTVRKRAHQ